MDEIYKRRSYHDGFDGTKKISDDDINAILKAGMNAPSANDTQPWEFVLINDAEKLQELSSLNHWTRAVGTSSHTIIVCMKPDIYAGIDCGIAVQNIVLQAAHMDIGSLIMGVHDNEGYQQKIKSLLNIPDEYIAYSMIALGYPAETIPPNDKWYPEKIRLNSF